MLNLSDQLSLDFEPSPAELFDRDSAKRAIDELFVMAQAYRSSRAYLELINFIANFRTYSPFNAMLVHTQMPGAVFVAPAGRWQCVYRRRLRPGAQPLVILQPMGPVMFVFDVSDTEPEKDAPPLPQGVERPFEARCGSVGGRLDLTAQNALRDGISIKAHKAGAHGAGSIQTVTSGKFVRFQTKSQPEPEFINVPLRYAILLNEDHSPETQYGTLTHELAHLYCGHLGTPDLAWWPDRRGLDDDVCEFEAESIAYLVCNRAGILTPSETYLAGYCNRYDETPRISLDCVLRAAGLIEQMGRERLPPRKVKPKAKT